VPTRTSGSLPHDAVAETRFETRFLASKSYEWVLEGDITACFDEISHSALMDLVRTRVFLRRLNEQGSPA
jgi:RNA-directed DNA polymerase